MSASEIRKSLDGAYQSLLPRIALKEITRQQAQALVAERASEFVDNLDLARVPAEQAWEYADIMRTAQRWDLAEKAYRVAVEKAKNEDRRVNDSLRWAQCQAKLGRIEQAIATSRTVFNAKPEDKAPILPAVLLELVPAARGKAYDSQLAKLLEDAIAQHQAVVVDPESDAGKAFIAAKSHHIGTAWRTIIDLLHTVGDRRGLDEALKRAEESMRSFAKV